jgi:thiol-disulfide isomerase/thioredoxin
MLIRFRCGPCKMIAPHLEEMSKNMDDVVFLKVLYLVRCCLPYQRHKLCSLAGNNSSAAAFYELML